MSSESLLWVAFSVAAAVASAGFFTRLRYRLRRRPTYRPSRDGWQRGFPNLMGLCVSVFAMGMGLGGVWFSRSAPQARGLDEQLRSSAPAAAVQEDSAVAVREDSAAAVQEDSATAVQDEPVPAAIPADPSAGQLPAGEPFAVRVGVFGNPANANAMVTDLTEAGFQPTTVRRAGSTGNPLYFVYAATFPTRAEAESAAELVRALGKEAMVVEIRDPAGT